MAEQRLLLALDFAGDVLDIVAQPFRLRFATVSGWRMHVPDFLAVTSGGVRLFDVRPAGRIGERDRVCFAATAEAALSAGWGYAVVAGWRGQVMATVEALSAQRRALADPLGLERLLVQRLGSGGCGFGELVGAMPVPALARAQVLHLLWRRRFGVDLAAPLTDRSTVWLSASERTR